MADAICSDRMRATSSAPESRSVPILGAAEMADEHRLAGPGGRDQRVGHRRGWLPGAGHPSRRHESRGLLGDQDQLAEIGRARHQDSGQATQRVLELGGPVGQLGDTSEHLHLNAGDDRPGPE